MFRGFKYILKPGAAQAATLRQWAGATRLVYNLALEQRRDFWRQYRRVSGRHLGWAQQSREVTQLRKEYEWLAAVPRVCLEQAIRDLDRAYAAYFAGRAGYPSPRAKGRHDTLRFQVVDISVRKLNRRWSAVRLPNLGWIKFRDTRPMSGDLRQITVRLGAEGWSVAFDCEIEFTANENLLPEVGIDRGVARTLTLSTGEHVSAPAMEGLALRIKRARRALSRKTRGSKRYAVQRRKAARLHSKSARMRTDWAHRASTDIARRFGLVAIETLNIKAMTASAAGTVNAPGRGVRQKAGLNRSILEQSWGRWATLLEYKLAERGGVLISVPAAYTSQTCSACGVVDARSRKSQAVFECVACDHRDNADVNAAKEILRRSTAWLGVEGTHRVPAEPPILAAA